MPCDSLVSPCSSTHCHFACSKCILIEIVIQNMSLHVARHMTWVLKPCQMWKWFAALHIYFGKCIPASCITTCAQVNHRDIICIQKVVSHPFSHIIFSYSSTTRLCCCTTLVFGVTSIATKNWITFALHSRTLWTCLVDMIISYTFLLWRHCLNM